MKKIVLSLIIISMFFSAYAQSWTNYYNGYDRKYSFEITDSLIFVGGNGIISVYTNTGEYRYSKLTNASHYSSTIDNAGNVWFTNKYNVLKFDGENWSSHRPDIMEDMECSSIACDKNNNIWTTFSSYSSDEACISKYNGTNWQNYNTFNDTITITDANRIVVDTNNVIYIGIDVDGNNWYYGILRINETDTTIFHYGNSNCSIACRHSSYLDKDNNVWFGGCYNNLLRFDGNDWFREGDAPELHNKSFYAIYKDTAENLWLGTSSGLFVQNEDSWINYDENNELDWDYIWDIKGDANNNIWMVASANPNYSENEAKNGCLIKYDETGFTHYYPNTFKKEPKKVIFRNNETWVISDVAISVLKNGLWQINNINEAISYNGIKDVAVDANNNIWMISNNELYKIDANNNLEVITNILGHDLIDNRCLATLNNNVWMNFSTYLMRFNGENWIKIDITNLPVTYFNVIQPVSTNEIWIGTNTGAMHFDGSSWTTYTDASGLVNNIVRDIVVEDDKVWFATNRGLSLYDGTEWSSYLHDSSFNTSSYNSNSSIHIDKNGHKWIGCLKGIYRYDNYNFHFMQPNDIEESINYITEDMEGNVWVAGQHGLSKYTFAPDNIEQDNIAESSLELFPNPAGDFFQIEVDNLNKQEVLKIYTISGKCIHNQTIYNGTNTIKTNSLQPGIYIVKLANSLRFAKLAIE
ncbi:MAG: T9SS type A sorting domain-containing protein [Bacteroidales bacterium]|nr:T9SS type A sorting domain-containing protein [Bacteroidales bacterium]